MGLYEVPLSVSLLGFGIGTMLAKFHYVFVQSINKYHIFIKTLIVILHTTLTKQLCPLLIVTVPLVDC